MLVLHIVTNMILRIKEGYCRFTSPHKNENTRITIRVQVNNHCSPWCIFITDDLFFLFAYGPKGMFTSFVLFNISTRSGPV